MRPLDPRILPYLRPAHRPLVGVLAGGLSGGLLTVAQAFALGTLLVRLVEDPGGTGWVEPARGWPRSCWPARWRPTSWTPARRRPRPGSPSRCGRGILAGALALDPQALSRRRTGELSLLATRGMVAIEPYLTRYLPTLVLAAVLPARHHRLDLLARLAQRPDRGAHPPAGAGVRGPHRPGHPRPRRPAVAAAGRAVGSLPRRDARAAHARGLPPGPGPGRLDPADHQPLPRGHPGDPQDRVRLLGRPGADRHDLGGAGGRERRPPSRRRTSSTSGPR